MTSNAYSSYQSRLGTPSTTSEEHHGTNNNNNSNYPSFFDMDSWINNTISTTVASSSQLKRKSFDNRDADDDIQRKFSRILDDKDHMIHWDDFLSDPQHNQHSTDDFYYLDPFTSEEVIPMNGDCGTPMLTTCNIFDTPPSSPFREDNLLYPEQNHLSDDEDEDDDEDDTSDDSNSQISSVAFYPTPDIMESVYTSPEKLGVSYEDVMLQLQKQEEFIPAEEEEVEQEELIQPQPLVELVNNPPAVHHSTSTVPPTVVDSDGPLVLNDSIPLRGNQDLNPSDRNTMIIDEMLGVIDRLPNGQSLMILSPERNRHKANDVPRKDITNHETSGSSTLKIGSGSEKKFKYFLHVMFKTPQSTTVPSLELIKSSGGGEPIADAIKIHRSWLIEDDQIARYSMSFQVNSFDYDRSPFCIVAKDTATGAVVGRSVPFLLVARKTNDCLFNKQTTTATPKKKQKRSKK